jgi:hypothetical protein
MSLLEATCVAMRRLHHPWDYVPRLIDSTLLEWELGIYGLDIPF